MGTSNRCDRLDSMDGRKSLEIEAPVLTGGSYAIVPSGTLKDLGVSPIDRLSLVLADGRTVECDKGAGSVRRPLRGVRDLVQIDVRQR